MKVEQGKGTSLEEAAKKIGVAFQAFVCLRKEFGALCVDQAKRLNEFEQESTVKTQRRQPGDQLKYVE